MHVSWVFKELCCSPQGLDVCALLQLQSHLSHQVKVFVRLSQISPLRGNVPAVARVGATAQQGSTDKRRAGTTHAIAA